jgi:hypothetical protein
LRQRNRIDFGGKNGNGGRRQLRRADKARERSKDLAQRFVCRG